MLGLLLLLGFLLAVVGLNGTSEEEVDEPEPYDAHDDGIIRVELIGEERPDTQWVSEIHFDPGDPKNWEDYKGQKEQKEFIQLQIDVLEHDEGLKHIYIAEKGSGKTTLFRIVGKNILEKRPGRYIEVTPAMLEDKEKLDELMGQLEARDILAIDEIHMLGRNKADILLPAIEDNLYPFADGMRPLPKGISWLGATTDIGLLPEAFQDRFHLISLDRLTEIQLAEILMEQPFTITWTSAKEIAHRAVGSPRELKRVYRVARDVARRESGTCIVDNDAEEAFRLLGLDENGLYDRDRAILEALYHNPKLYANNKKRHCQSERSLRALTGLDDSLYRDQIEPKLFRRGFVTIGTGGRILTEKAFDTYFPEHDPETCGCADS